MKRRMISLIAAMLIAVGPAFSQVIITEGDVNHNRVEGDASNNFGVMVLAQGETLDQWKYAPLDGGVLLLAGLGAAYLIGKRKKN